MRRRRVEGVVGAVRVALNSVDKRVEGGRRKKRIIPIPSGGGEVCGVSGRSLLPNRPLTSRDIEAFIMHHEIPHFRGVFMRDGLPRGKPWRHECMIVNQDSTGNGGTHWTCYVKSCKNVFYFDSFGRLPPALEVIKYLDGCSIYYNTRQYQRFNTIVCGHLCLCFLYEYYKNSMKHRFFI